MQHGGFNTEDPLPADLRDALMLITSPGSAH